MKIKTDWYPGLVLPKRPGVYERDYEFAYWSGPAFCKFDGLSWYISFSTVDGASSTNSKSNVLCNWRGLTIRAKRNLQNGKQI